MALVNAGSVRKRTASFFSAAELMRPWGLSLPCGFPLRHGESLHWAKPFIVPN